MAKLDVKGKDGKKVGTVDLSDALANFEPAKHLMHAAVVTEEANSRQGTQRTKDRSDVKGGGKKPYKQKKTGRARQGTIRAPQYAHGGMAHSIDPRDYGKKMNRKERRAAILGALASKLREDAVIVADSIAFGAPKTAEARNLLKALEIADARRILVVLPQYDETTYKSFRNLANVVVRTAPASAQSKEAAKTAVFSARDLLVAHKVVIAKDALARIEEAWSK